MWSRQTGDVDMVGLLLRLSWPGLEWDRVDSHTPGVLHTNRPADQTNWATEDINTNLHSSPSPAMAGHAANLQHKIAWHLFEILRITNQMYGMMPFNKTIHLNGWN